MNSNKQDKRNGFGTDKDIKNTKISSGSNNKSGENHNDKNGKTGSDNDGDSMSGVKIEVNTAENGAGKYKQEIKDMNDQDKLVRNIDSGSTKNASKDGTSKKNSSNMNNKQKRNIFDFLDADYLKRMIPFMHPDSKNHTFKYFIDKVHEVVDSVADTIKLVDDEVLDIMQFRMGGSYLSEMKDLRLSDTEIAAIKQFFLDKDNERDAENARKQQLLTKISQVSINILSKLQLKIFLSRLEMKCGFKDKQ